MYHRLVGLAKPKCRQVDKEKASTALLDTSGIETWVTEASNVPKQLKTYKKANSPDDSYDPFKSAYGSIPSHATANPAM